MRRTKRGDIKPHQSSIVINIMPVLQARCIKFPDAYLKKLGISSTTTTKLLNGEASQISARTLTKICVALECTPNDLFALRDMPLHKSHPLLNLPDYKPVSDMMSVEEFFRGKTVEEVRKMLKR
ncbi:MAG: helix-turn-helix domain-containing protein [Flavobacterium sp.]|nr:helix-turn-helix domain-containing protein [Flavobacterium sp.]